MRCVLLSVCVIAVIGLAACGPSESEAAAPRARPSTKSATPTPAQPSSATGAAAAPGTNAVISFEGEPAEGGDADGARKAFGSILDALQGGEVESALKRVLTPSEPQRRQRAGTELGRLAEKLGAGDVTIEVGEARVQGAWAVVDTTITLSEDGETQTMRREQFLLRHNGAWWLVPELIRSDPAVRPLLDADFRALFEWYRAQLGG
jgi:predicted lipid-binding transport protein (Tim44 family)